MNIGVSELFNGFIIVEDNTSRSVIESYLLSLISIFILFILAAKLAL